MSFGLCIGLFCSMEYFFHEAGFRLFRVLKTSNYSVLRRFTSIMHLPDAQFCIILLLDFNNFYAFVLTL